LSTGRKFVFYAFGAIALYLVVTHATGAGTLITDTTSGGSRLVSAFQGRAS
jgi:hypothetical protein